ncbi:MAG: flavodoxin family protein [Ruminiclostridium sp.]|nr:flavodoxin family protein [Ruminiclostridium sp.]
MKIIAINGSYRKNGNTYHAVEKIKEQLLEIDKNIEFEHLFLSDYQIKNCTGCFTCFAKGEDKCPLKDDISTLRDKMKNAHGIIFASPTYAMGVTGIMKNFIDRLTYTMHRPYFFDSVFLGVTTIGGVMGARQGRNQVSALAVGGILAGKYTFMYPPVSMRGIEKGRKKTALKAAMKLYKLLPKSRRCPLSSLGNDELLSQEGVYPPPRDTVTLFKRKLPGFSDWAYFHSFKTMTQNEQYKAECPADYAYYAEREEFFYPIQGHPFRKLIGKMVKGLMNVSMGLLIKK